MFMSFKKTNFDIKIMMLKILMPMMMMMILKMMIMMALIRIMVTLTLPAYLSRG